MSNRVTSSTATAPMPQSTMAGGVPHEKVAMRAYEKWCKKGCPQGTHMQDWFEAENEIRAEIARSAPTRR